MSAHRADSIQPVRNARAVLAWVFARRRITGTHAWPGPSNVRVLPVPCPGCLGGRVPCTCTENCGSAVCEGDQ